MNRTITKAQLELGNVENKDNNNIEGDTNV